MLEAYKFIPFKPRSGHNKINGIGHGLEPRMEEKATIRFLKLDARIVVGQHRRMSRGQYSSTHGEENHADGHGQKDRLIRW
jgi:hypothetical protein